MIFSVCCNIFLRTFTILEVFKSIQLFIQEKWSETKKSKVMKDLLVTNTEKISDRVYFPSMKMSSYHFSSHYDRVEVTFRPDSIT